MLELIVGDSRVHMSNGIRSFKKFMSNRGQNSDSIASHDRKVEVILR
jgi:hypothetical protein